MNSKISWRELLPLYAVIFLGFLGFALTITLFIPMLMDKQFSLLSPSLSSSWRALLSGLLLAMYPLGQFVGSPIIGNLSDHFGRKKVLLISLLACALGFMGMALSIEWHQLVLLFLSAFLTGLCESNMALSQSIIADGTDDGAHKTRLIGYAYSACSFGYFLGPLFGGSLGASLGYSAPFWAAALGVLLVIAWVFYGLKNHSSPRGDQPVRIIKSLAAIKTLFDQPKFYKFYLINFSIFFAVQGLYRVVPLYTMQHWSLSLHTYSYLIAYVSLICFVTNLILLGPLSKKWSTKILLTIFLIFGGGLVILIVIPDQFHWIYLTYGLAVIPTVMALPLCTTWLSMHAASHEQGQILGNNQALLVLGEASSAGIGGALAAVSISLPTIMMGVILLITGVAVFWSRR